MSDFIIGEPCIPGIWGSRRHKFEPRYSRKWSIKPGDIKVSGSGVGPEDFMDQIYEGDVCVYCGRIVNRRA